jgi:hypothetical protein
VVGRDRYDTGRRAPRGPIAKVSSRSRKRRAIGRCLRLGVGFAGRLDGVFDLRQASLGDVIGMLRDRPLRELFEIFGILVPIFDDFSDPNLALRQLFAEIQNIAKR